MPMIKSMTFVIPNDEDIPVKIIVYNDPHNSIYSTVTHAEMVEMVNHSDLKTNHILQVRDEIDMKVLDVYEMKAGSK